MSLEGILQGVVDVDAELAELIEEELGPHVAAIGGGHGLAIALKAARCYAGAISAIVSVADDGGSSGRLTESLGIPAPGDLRRCLLALTPEVSVWTELFGFRFEDNTSLTGSAQGVDGHSLGNLLIAALSELRGDFFEAVTEASHLLGTMGEVIPAADQPVTLSGVVDGEVVLGQATLSKTKGPVERITLGPEGIAARPESIEAIESADQIVLGPGSLFTSTIAALLVPGVVDAIDGAPGRLVFVLNLVTQDGETLGVTGEGHLRALKSMTGLKRGGVIVAHAGPLIVPHGHDALDIEDQTATAHGWRVIRADVADELADWPAHDPAKLGRVLEIL